MFHTVASVEPLPDYRLMVGFKSGERKVYDVKPLFERWSVFRELESIKGLFGCVRVDTGGYGIVWNDELDLSCDELWANGEGAD